jgi:hypothetical protein
MTVLVAVKLTLSHDDSYPTPHVWPRAVGKRRRARVVIRSQEDAMVVIQYS